MDVSFCTDNLPFFQHNQIEILHKTFLLNHRATESAELYSLCALCGSVVCLILILPVEINVILIISLRVIYEDLV